MTRNALVLSLAIFAGFANPVFANLLPAPFKTGQAISPSPDAKVNWPDYKAKPWTVSKQEPLAVEVQIPVKDNKYVLGPGRYDVMVGTISVFMDSPDIQKSTMAVSEGDVLGKGVVFRVLQMRNVGVLSMQLKVDGKWQDVPRDSRLMLEVMDPENVISKSELKGVALRILEGETEKLKIIIENKPADKPKK